jgi:hypothetical protein
MLNNRKATTRSKILGNDVIVYARGVQEGEARDRACCVRDDHTLLLDTVAARKGSN